MNREDNLNWYHRNLPREEAEEKLTSMGIDGVFLVHDSVTSPGDYVLSVLNNNQVFHYQIRRHGDDAFFSIDDQTPIHGLDSLIEQYRKKPDGLVTKLSAIVPKLPPPAESRRHGHSNLLHRATKNGNLRIVEEKLMSHSKTNTYPLDAKDEEGRSVVHLACLVSIENNAESILSRLIGSGANVNCRDEKGNTPLHYACLSKPVSFIQMLIDAQALIDARNILTGRVPLHEAASTGNLEVVKKLLELGVPHLPRSIDGDTPATLARDGNHTATVEFLEQYSPPAPMTHASQWCHGTLSRNESGKMLIKYSKEQQLEDASGTFLVRHSTRENTYVLGLLCDDNETRNYVIRRHALFYYIDEGPYMLSLDHLIEHYMRFKDGLPTKLRFPVPPKPKPPLPPPPAQAQDTLPKPSKSIKKMLISALSRSPGAQASLDESTREQRTSKESDSLPNTPPQVKERNLSLPSDDLISSPTEPVSHKIKSSPRKASTDILSFSSLKFPSNKRIIIDGIKTIGSSKKEKKQKETIETASNLVTNEKISKSLKELTFSSGFKEDDDSVYKVPSNIPAIDVQNQNSVSSIATLPLTNRFGSQRRRANMENDEMELFTQSDKCADQEIIAENLDKDNSIEEIYFVEAPTRAVPIAVVPVSFNYVSFNQIPYFPAASTSAPVHDSDSMNTNNNNNSKISKTLAPSASRDERVLSVMSTFSKDLDMMLQSQNTANGNTSDLQGPNYYIPLQSIHLDTILGTGEFGSVYHGQMTCQTQNGESKEIQVAIKTLHNEQSKENRFEFLREASIMIKLSHHCIVKMIGISKGPPLMIVQELVSLGSLSEYLVNNRDQINPNSELKIWASQIACGMNYLESQHFVHRDLAARNILLSSVHQAKISDFGFSRALCAGDNYYQASHNGKWPIKWYAPESFNYGTFSHASDVWSFGVTLWEMFSFGEPPYGEMKGSEVIALVEKGTRLLQPPKCPDHVFEIMSNCWNYHPKDRPTFRYLTEFFSSDPDYQNLIELIKTQNIY